MYTWRILRNGFVKIYQYQYKKIKERVTIKNKLIRGNNKFKFYSKFLGPFFQWNLYLTSGISGARNEEGGFGESDTHRTDSGKEERFWTSATLWSLPNYEKGFGSKHWGQIWAGVSLALGGSFSRNGVSIKSTRM